MRGLLRRKSDDTWQARIFRGRDEAGRQLFDYHTVHAVTKREAQSALTALLHGLDTGSYAEPSRMTVGEWLATWMNDYAAPSVAPYTLDGYRQIVDKRLVPALGSVRLNQLTPTRIQRYYTEELTSGRAKGGGDCPLAPCSLIIACCGRRWVGRCASASSWSTPVIAWTPRERVTLR